MDRADVAVPNSLANNHIVIAPTILSRVALAGTIVIAGAMHTQRSVSNQPVDAGADFVWTVKDNQAKTR